MSNKYFDPLELAVKLRKAKQTGDTSEIWNYTKTFLDSPTNSKEKKTEIPSMDPAGLNGYIHEMINQSFKQSLGMYHKMFDNSNLDSDDKKKKNQTINQEKSKQQPVQQEKGNNNSVNSIGFESTSDRNMNADVFETHDYVIVRVKIPKNINPKAIKARATFSRLYIRFNNYLEEEMILLPAEVDKNDIKASIVNNILEIIIPKEKGENQKNIDIQY